MTISKIATRNKMTASLNMDKIFAETADPKNISFGMGLPDKTIFPDQALKTSFMNTFNNQGPDIFQYHSTQGPVALRNKIVSLVKKYYHIDVNGSNIILTQGGQQAIDIVGRTFLNKNDHIVVEGPTYMGALEAFDGYEPIYHEVNVEHDGMDMTVLEQILSETPNIKFVYTIPDFQNPTGATMSLAKRKTLIQLAEKYDFYIVEDSPYRYLRYSGQEEPSLADLDTNGRVILISSFSKILSPALRTGWLIANDELTSIFLSVKAALDVQPSHINLMAIDDFLEHHNIDRHIAKINTLYREKCLAMCDNLDKYLPEKATYIRPEGGFFVWVTLPESFDTTKLLLDSILQDANVVYVPSELQYASRSIKNKFRLNFTNSSYEQIETGIKKLSEAVEAVLQLS